VPVRAVFPRIFRLLLMVALCVETRARSKNVLGVRMCSTALLLAKRRTGRFISSVVRRDSVDLNTEMCASAIFIMKFVT